MGCELSTLGFGLPANKRIAPAETSPIEPIRHAVPSDSEAARQFSRRFSCLPDTDRESLQGILSANNIVGVREAIAEEDEEAVEVHRPLSRTSSLGSVMDQRPPSGISNASFTRVYKNRSLNRSYTIDTTRSKSNQPVVGLCSRKIGIEEYPSGKDDGKPCDVYWHCVVYPDMRSVVKGGSQARVNKFPGMTELAKKISLTHAISSMQKIFPEEYAFYPKSWFLPAHMADFQKFCKQEGERRKKTAAGREERWFIVKPDEGAQGTGIYLINSPDQIQDPNQKQLVQEYIADPYLMSDELKFDFRVYGVIKSLNPLSIYVAREGMARFCTEKYSKPTSSNFDNLYSHLTNYSLNKGNDTYVHSNSLKDQVKGSKRLLSTVFHQLESRGLKTKKLWHEIKLILVKTVLAMLPEIMLHYEHHFFDLHGPHCFQIMGFDVMVKADGTPILLEVNAAPSLSIDHTIPLPGKTLEETSQRVRSIVDEVIKIPLVKDTLLLVLGLLDEEYSDRSDSSSTVKTAPRFQDDMSSLTAKRKPHLSEIFPTRYGAHSGHLLFLDKAMYIYMQFLQLRNTVNISGGGLKQFVRKCNLSNVIDPQEVDTKMAEINYYFTGDKTTLGNGLPFHAFLQFMFFVAEKKFPHEEDLLAKMQRLMAFCDMSLRHYGVRSARLRREEVDTNQTANPVEIYMLPGRMKVAKRRSKSSEPGAERKADAGRTKDAKDRNNNSNSNTLTLPKIAQR